MSGMSKIVKTISSIAFPFVMIYGLYVIAHGHLTPGGGFQGGAVVASACAMILVAYGSIWTMGKIKEKQLSVLESVGAVCFILLALLGLLIIFSNDGIFFKNFLANTNYLFGTSVTLGTSAANINTAGVLPLMNFAVGLKVIAGLFAIVLVMAYATNKIKGGKAE
jgi:multicomponent Na+:H+ antiporter subunit B